MARGCLGGMMSLLPGSMCGDMPVISCVCSQAVCPALRGQFTVRFELDMIQMRRIIRGQISNELNDIQDSTRKVSITVTTTKSDLKMMLLGLKRKNTTTDLNAEDRHAKVFDSEKVLLQFLTIIQAFHRQTYIIIKHLIQIEIKLKIYLSIQFLKFQY